jgi:hypothetical protein
LLNVININYKSHQMDNTFLIKLNSHISNIRERYGYLSICELLVSIAKDAYTEYEDD